MSLVLYHHPYSRAATVVWMLEEIGQPYALRFVDILKGEQKSSDHLTLNRMGKVPVLVDGDAVVSETAAIGVYLADRYALGRLAPALDDPRRGAWLRWCFYAPSVIEPAAMAHSAKWEARPSSVGWGTFESVVETLEQALGDRPWLLGEDFTMADLIVGATLRYLIRFKMIPSSDTFAAYSERLEARPALQAANARNAAVMAEHGLGG